MRVTEVKEEKRIRETRSRKKGRMTKAEEYWI
jgi:hypothetical protein